MDQVVCEIEKEPLRNGSASPTVSNISEDSRGSSPNGDFSEKEFKIRDSYLTTLWKKPEYFWISNFAYLSVAAAILYLIAIEFLEPGNFWNIFANFFGIFGQLYIALGSVAIFHASAILFVFPGYKLWEKCTLEEKNIEGKGYFMKLFYRSISSTLQCLLIVYFVSFMASAWAIKWYWPLSLGNSLIIIFEQVRVLLKMYAFIRTKSDMILHSKQDGKDFGRFLYFFFAPTLIYRDEYPRSKSRKWSSIFLHIINFTICLVLMYLIFTFFFKHFLQGFDVEGGYPLKKLLGLILCYFIYTTFYYQQVTFMLLHSSQNLFAELLRFGDRHFVGDWWNVKNYNSYYYKVNIIVFDFIRYYVTKDIQRVLPNYPNIRVVIILLFSAFLHDYSAAYVTGVWMPLFLFFQGSIGPLMRLINIKNPRYANFLIICANGIGLMTISLIYTLEVFARKYPNVCPPAVEEEFLDYFTPRFPFCNSFSIY